MKQIKSYRICGILYSLFFILSCVQELPGRNSERLISLISMNQNEQNSFENIITIQPGSAGKDVWITSVFASADDDKIRIGGWADWYYGLIEFNLTNLPSNVYSAKLYLYCYSSGGGTFVATDLYRNTSAWDETTVWGTQPATVFTNALSVPILNSWFEIDITAFYNDWQNNVYANYGISLRPTGNANEFNNWYSSDYNADPAKRPKLVIQINP